MTRIQPTRWTAAAACAAMIAAPLAAQAQFYPAPMYPRQPLPPGERVISYGGSPVFTPGDEGGPAEAAATNRESRQYEALVHSSPSFRAQREAQECGTVGDPVGQAECLSTFDYSQR